MLLLIFFRYLALDDIKPRASVLRGLAFLDSFCSPLFFWDFNVKNERKFTGCESWPMAGHSFSMQAQAETMSLH